MTRMRVTKAHRFNGRQVRVGEYYETRPHDNVRLITALGWATPAGGDQEPVSRQSYKTRDMAAEGREARGRPLPAQEVATGETSAHTTEDMPDMATKPEEDSTEVGIDDLRSKYEEVLGFAADRRWGRERLQRAIDEAS